MGHWMWKWGWIPYMASTLLYTLAVVIPRPKGLRIALGVVSAGTMGFVIGALVGYTSTLPNVGVPTALRLGTLVGAML